MKYIVMLCAMMAACVGSDPVPTFTDNKDPDSKDGSVTDSSTDPDKDPSKDPSQDAAPDVAQNPQNDSGVVDSGADAEAGADPHPLPDDRCFRETDFFCNLGGDPVYKCPTNVTLPYGCYSANDSEGLAHVCCN